MAEHREYLLRTRSRTRLRIRHRLVTLGTVTALTGCIGIVPGAVAPTAANATEVSCGIQTDSCLIDRYDDPTTDYGDLDDGNITVIPPGSAPSSAIDTTDYAARRNAPNGSGVNFGGLNAWPVGGAAGVDMWMLQSGVNNSRPYVPCKNTRDIYKKACQTPVDAGYYSMRSFSSGTSNPYPIGMLIPNATTNSNCPSTCTHYWGNRTYGADFEFYAKSGGNDADYVRSRFSVAGQFPATAGGNGWNMSPAWGSVPPRYVNDANVARLQGNVYRSPGVPDPDQRLRFSVFQHNTVSHAVTSTGKPLGSFAVGTSVKLTGRYSTGTLYSAVFNITVRDQSNGNWCRLNTRTFDNLNYVLNFTLDQPRFGLSPHMLGVTCNF